MAGKQRRTKAADPKKALRAARARANKDKHEVPFLRLWQGMYPTLPVPIRDYEFPKSNPGPRSRCWKWDYAFVEEKLAIELHGGGAGGRHTRLMGHATDCSKFNDGTRQGWRLLQFNVIHMKDMKAVIDLVALVLEGR